MNSQKVTRTLLTSFVAVIVAILAWPAPGSAQVQLTQCLIVEDTGAAAPAGVQLIPELTLTAGTDGVVQPLVVRRRVELSEIRPDTICTTAVFNDRPIPSPPVPPGARPFEPNYFVVDWNDEAVYVPIAGAGTSLPLHAGSIHPSVTTMTRGSSLVLAFDGRAASGAMENLFRQAAGPEQSGAIQSVVESAADAAVRVEAPEHGLIRSVPGLNSLSVVLMDDTGDGVFEVRCERPVAVLIPLSTGIANRVVSEMRAEDGELLVVGCERPFTVN